MKTFEQLKKEAFEKSDLVSAAGNDNSKAYAFLSKHEKTGNDDEIKYLRTVMELHYSKIAQDFLNALNRANNAKFNLNR